MALKRVTIQDIADACGLSRNTVSKVFNNRGAVPESTRKTVIQTAQELGYYQLLEETGYAPEISQNKNIALLTQHKLLSHNFGAFFITSFTDQVCRAGCTLKMFEISPQEIEDKKLPPHLSLKETAGFLCIELFSKPYQEMLCSLGIPCAFVDGYARTSKALMECDFISMENYAATLCLVERLIAAGAKRIGFVGDNEHCNSFYERWTAYSAALADAELTLDRSLCILEEDSENYGDVDWLLSRLTAMPTVPDAFVCANDYLAIHIMAALKRMGMRIPQDVMVTGFDGSPEASMAEPTLTTATIPSTDIGRLSAMLLIDRIRHPEHPCRWTNVKSTPVWGGSTR